MRASPVAERLAQVSWEEVEAALARQPYAPLPVLLDPEQCRKLVGLYADPARFRSRIDMERHRFGRGEYKYLRRPLPPLVAELRRRVYSPLRAIANRWMRALGSGERYPATLTAFEQHCARAGQRQPTPLLLRYEEGGYNCLHQDVYGPVGFPLQLVVFLSRPGLDYTGGEFLLVEQRLHSQSVGEALLLEQGQGLVIPNRLRPVAGRSGHYRAIVRHGVSRVRSGTRYTLGVIFHDAL